MLPFDPARSVQYKSFVGRDIVQDMMSRDRDAGQIALVRDYLRHQAEAFERRDIVVPATVSQDDLPGLADLRAGTGEIAVQFEETDVGGRITYRTAEPLLWQALGILVGASEKEQGVETSLNIGGLPKVQVVKEKRP